MSTYFPVRPRTFFIYSEAQQFGSGRSLGVNQMTYFQELFIFLMRQAGYDFIIDKYDDPTTVTSKMVVELKGIGFEADFSAVKLRSGYGEAVVEVLDYLCDRILNSQGFQFLNPLHDDENEEDLVEEDALEVFFSLSHSLLSFCSI